MTRASRACQAIALTLTLAVAGCGGSGHHRQTTRSSATTTAAAVKGLPTSAKPVFSSDVSAPHTTVATPNTTGSLVASSGFSPARDGFAFQNYGFIAGTELDQQVLRQMFGNGVCANAPSDSCTLTPAAAQWAQAMAGAMLGGHCYGFSMTALRFFTHNLKSSDYGASTTFGLPFSPALQDEIAANWAEQAVPAVERSYVYGTPSQIVDDLIASFKHHDPVYTLDLRSGSGQDSEGHAITPIGVTDLGGGRYQILVYDNNYPGITKAMQIDTGAETWSYQVQVNPSAPGAVWSGQGSSNKLSLAPIEPLEHVQQFPSSEVSNVDTVMLGGDPDRHAHLLITDGQGDRLGYDDGRFVDQIKGARVIRPLLNEIWEAHPEPIYQLPAGDRLSVALSGGDPIGSDAAQVYVTGPGFGANASGLAPNGSARAQLSVAAGGANVSLQLTGTAPSTAPTLALARNRGRGGNTVTVAPSRLVAGDVLSIGLPTTGRHVHVTSSKATGSVSVKVATVGQRGVRTSLTHGVVVAPGHGATLSLGLIDVG